MRQLSRHLMFVFILVLVPWAVLTRPIMAQSAQQEPAFALFEQGVELMTRGDCQGAIVKFQASLESEPNPSTMMNLAVCHQRMGNLAAARQYYREAGRLAEPRGAKEIITDADAAARELEERLSRLIIQLSARTDIQDLEITHDGQRVLPERLGEVIYSDPGAQQIEANAAGYRSFETTVNTREGEETVVEIPPLERVVAIPTDRPSSGKTRRVLGITGASVGLVSVLAGLGVGWSARNARDDAFNSGACDRDTSLCTMAGQYLMDTAHRRALYADILVGAGVVLAGTGIVLWLSAPKHKQKRPSSALVPTAGPDHFGVAFSGRF
jgi:hypothetical protein